MVPHMKSEELDLLLGEIARQPVPLLGAGFRHDVWRAIRHRRFVEEQSGWTRWEGWFASLLHPRPILAALSLALACGLLSGVWLKESPSVSKAMQLEVFSVNAPGMPSTLWEQ